MTTVLVTDAGRGSAVAFIRSLDRAGHTVIAGDEARISAGRWSRSTHASFRYPNPYVDPAGAAERILAEIVRREVAIVLPITDATTGIVESLRDRLPAGCRIGTPPADAAAVAADKERTVALAERLGVPVPSTIVVDTPEAARSAGATLGWPVVVKPASSLGVGADGVMRKFEVGYGFDADDLDEKVRFLGGGAPVLLQEQCSGAGIGVEVLVDRGEVVLAFSHRRIHEVPVTGGASALRESVPLDPELLEYSTRLMQELKWTGLAMVEFKSGAAGHRLMEINGRPWGSLPLAVRAGADFPAEYVQLLLGERSASSTGTPAYEAGVTARDLRLEIVWIASVLRGPPSGTEVVRWPARREAGRAILSLFSPRISNDILSLRDPLPGVAELWSIVSRLVRKAGR